MLSLRFLRTIAAAIASTLLWTTPAPAAITIQTVPVGNPGNPKDPATGNLYGQVNYTYSIGKYEVTAGQYTAFLNAVAPDDPYGLYNRDMARTDVLGCGITRSGSWGSYVYTVAPDLVNRPVNYVSFGDAMRFANWLQTGATEGGAYTLNGATSDADVLAVTRNAGATWAVTSEDEWYKAAYYNPATSSYYLYPTSSDTAPGRDLADASGNNANYWDYFPSPYPIDGTHYSTVVGEFQNSPSPYGTFDQGGNVWEWNEAVIGLASGLRGGSFNNTIGGLPADFRSYDNPSIEDYSRGFRVSYVPEPASVGLLSLGFIGLLVRRRGAGR